MRMPLNPEFLALELVFTLVALVLGLLIYFKTKESYELTRHTGIKYFRDAFLFLGLAYLLRFLFSILFMSRIILDTSMPRDALMPAFMILLGYFSTIGLWCLMLSSTWKRFGSQKYLVIGNIFAIIVSTLAFVMHSPDVMLYIQLVLVAAYIILTMASPTEKKKFSQTKMLYFFVAILWITNLLAAGKPMPRELGILFQLAAIVLFSTIYHKISKWVN